MGRLCFLPFDDNISYHVQGEINEIKLVGFNFGRVQIGFVFLEAAAI